MNKIYPEGDFSTSKFVSVKHKEYEMIVEDILNNIEKVNTIHITGSLQSPNHCKLIDKIPKEHAKNIKLVYDTNLILRYKNHSVYDIEDKFKKCILKCYLATILKINYHD